MKRKPRLINSIASLIIGFSYPVVKYISSESNKMLGFLDSLTIIGFIYLLCGVFYYIYLRGDLDALIFKMKHPKFSDPASFEVFSKNQKKERENSFNYPLFEGILFIAVSYVLATFCY